MRPLRFSINITLDGCIDHREGSADQHTHSHAAQLFEQSDATIFGRVTYEMMESAWREPARTGVRPDWMDEWMLPFARAIDASKKYVVSSKLKHVDWNAELVRSDELENTVRKLKQQPGKGIFVAGHQLAQSLTELGLIDEYDFMVHPKIAGHGPMLFAGLSKPLDLKLISRAELPSGAVVMKFQPRR